ncbi:hypothetical protein SAMN02745163_02498 [Clostridium cavendishii DSM 21758]|uniref:Tetratricopeptide repeat-containing protein n=1 Tax=Clostridium cavendishii DSM 21758 TaxID=1121302 RepID=A0A1M6LUD2_9CLOT|nr:hypothetical protein [Clostridium cavendishii]SHJ74712.1 hypothetical protein SAMN02745163_02498 [Clostridium cavendishii DSM 21758]
METLSERIKFAENLRESGKYYESIEIYLKAKEDCVQKNWINFIIGDIFYIIGDLEQSKKYYIKCLENGNTGDSLILHLGHALLDGVIKDDYQGALVEAYKEWIDIYYKNNVERLYDFVDIDLEDMTSYDYKCYIVAKEYIENNV